MFDDVLSSPDNRTHQFVKVHRRKGMEMKKWYPGPSSQEVMQRLFLSEHPSVTPTVPRLLDGVLQDDVCELFSPPRILKHTKKLGLRWGVVSWLDDRVGLPAA